jgi:hypothetical protein
MKRVARVDANQKEIVEAFRKLGATVLHLHQIGQGCPDILVGYQGSNYLVEIKDGAKSPSHRKLTDDQKTFHSKWNGQVCIINSINEIKPLLNNKNMTTLSREELIENLLIAFDNVQTSKVLLSKWNNFLNITEETLAAPEYVKQDCLNPNDYVIPFESINDLSKAYCDLIEFEENNKQIIND